jgi:hypothetical protein
MRKLSAKWFPKCLNADQKVNGANDFLSGAIGDHERNLVMSL